MRLLLVLLACSVLACAQTHTFPAQDTNTSTNAFSGNPDFSGNPTSSATPAIANLNNIRFADQFAGANWCAKVAAADSDLGSGPGEIWINNAVGTSACAATWTLARNHVYRFTQGGTYNLCSSCSPGVTVPPGADNVTILAATQNGAANGTQLKWSGTGGTGFVIGGSSADTKFVAVQGIKFDFSGASGATTNGVQAVRAQGLKWHDNMIVGLLSTNGLTSLGDGLDILGTGNYIANVDIQNSYIQGNWTKGFYSNGPSLNTSDFHLFRHLSITRNSYQPGAGTIGFHWGNNSGDGQIAGIDVENYDTGYQIDGRLLYGIVRSENNTSGIIFGASSTSNMLWQQSAGDTMPIKYAGSFNSVFDPIGFTVAPTGGSFIQRNQQNGLVFSDLQAGSSSDQFECHRFLDKGGAVKWRLCKDTLNQFYIGDGTNIRFLLAGGTNDDTDLRAAGTGYVLLNVNGGTGGVAFKTSTFSNLGSVPVPGRAKYCLDCTTAAICAGSGTGHLAVSNGRNWTCQ